MEKNFEGKINIHIATWNTNGQCPTECMSLKDWLRVGKSADSVDLYAIGFQEIEWTWSKDFENGVLENKWRILIQNALQQSDVEYEEIATEKFDGLCLMLFVKKSLRNTIRNISSTVFTSPNPNTKIKNGAVATTFNLDDQSFCFVNAHLTPHVHNFELRNQECHQLCNQFKFDNGNTVLDHDHIFMFGDFNYRINPDQMDIQLSKSLLAAGKFAQVLKHDQLEEGKKGGKIFQDFVEGPITFLPTYKYDLGSNDWDSSQRMRAPAWCDRIMYKGHKGGKVEQVEYTSHQKYMLSDHKPVSSTYELFNF